jgi:hypothetical protein
VGENRQGLESVLIIGKINRKESHKEHGGRKKREEWIFVR